MNTAMDDGRHESLGEQTLSIPRLTDEVLAAPHPPSASGPKTTDAGTTPRGAADGVETQTGAADTEAAEEPRAETIDERPEPHDATAEESLEPHDAAVGPESRAETLDERPEPRDAAVEESLEPRDAAVEEPIEKPATKLGQEPPLQGPQSSESSKLSDSEPWEPWEPFEPSESRGSFEPSGSLEPLEPLEPCEPSAVASAEASGELPGAAPAKAAEEPSADPDDEPQEEASAKTDAPAEPDDAEAPSSDTTEGRSSSGKSEAAERPSAGRPEGASAGEAEAAEEASSGEEVSSSEEASSGEGASAGEVEEELPAEAVEELMAALGALRESVADVRFGLDLPGAEEARQARTELLAQLEDYVLPRVRTRAAPALIVVAGSTGAGKSTLVNSLAEKNISRTGVRRPTTGTPVLACHPDDRAWFVEGDLLRGLRRLDRPSPDAGMSSLVVVTTEKLPQGVALLDTPDIDSVVEEHHEVAHRMLDAADLWIFVTTAARYADAPAWNLLRLAKERGARLAIVLSRVQPRSREVVLKHFVRMLTEYGLGEIDRFVINESKVVDGRLPDSEVTDLRMWLAELSVDEARRAQAVKETLTGVLNSFRTRVPALAKHLETQVAFRSELRADVETAYRSALADVDKAFRSGSLLHGEVLARWQDFTGSGELMRSFQLRRRGKAARQAPERLGSFRTALRSGVESVIVAAATRAAEEVVGRWRRRAELGATLAEGLDRPSDDFLRQAGRAIAAWQDHVGELVSTEGVAKRSVSKLVSFDPESLSLIFMVAMFSGGHAEGVPHRLVNALLGAESLRGIGAKALSDLRARIGMLFDEESMRYVKALDSAGVPDESIATRLYQATYNLEVVR
ncbi:GTPase [Nonomuraea pusilla]|uniref:GTPase n=1 Tax=Nonomuraea pusilla TaxID=46177 RepID=UPI00331DADEF